ncbi:YfbR-like 5'-deoxynucleotidase [Paenibacillus aestuarii]|uniref:YfbR-like 5'-deoxynucleotidase n=1 Tax=Paenibacillus aestuarii TaxID=516965 RepID=A0ABW0KJ49_9BACL|nr:YfbR-like 5'-deoxynucleotidase [Paenibacillus aestuarii]
MGILSYFQNLTKLEKIVRHPVQIKFEEYSVAAHSWKVIQYAKVYADIEEQHGAVIDWKKLYQLASRHDYGEIFVNEFKTPKMFVSSELQSMVEKVEQAMIYNFVEEQIPATYRSIFHQQLMEVKDNSIECQIVLAADGTDHVFEAFAEFQRGNESEEYVTMYQNALITLKGIRLHCLDHFLQVILPDLLHQPIAANLDIQHLTDEALALHIV